MQEEAFFASMGSRSSKLARGGVLLQVFPATRRNLPSSSARELDYVDAAADLGEALRTDPGAADAAAVLAS